MIFYHASKHAYDFPDYNKLTKNRENHLNGNLGLWVASKNDWISGFGNIIYEVEIDDKDVSIILVDHLFSWEKENDMSEDYYINLRIKLLEKYKSVAFIENSGSVGMGIILDFSVIKSFKPVVPTKKLKV